MKLVYLIAAHYNPEAFESLLHALNGAPVIAHIDAKTDITPFKAVADTNVTFTKRRVNVLWGGWSQVDATLEMMREAFPTLEPDDYVILLSGDSYPLQSQEDLARFFESSNGAQYINSVSMPSKEASKPLTRLSRLYIEYNPHNGKRNLLPRIINNLAIRRNYKAALNGRAPHAGSTWWAFTGAALKWMLTESDGDTRFLKFCRWTKMPDEFYFQTLLASSPFSLDVRPSLMYTDWSRPTGPKPAILDYDHIQALAERGLAVKQAAYGDYTALFARKVTSTEMPNLIQTRLWALKFFSGAN